MDASEIWIGYGYMADVNSWCAPVMVMVMIQPVELASGLAGR